MDPNWVNRTLFTGDNLDVMRGMDSESVDLIYLDPPFNSNKTYRAPLGSAAAGAAFKDTWTLADLDEASHGEIAEKDPVLYCFMDAVGKAHSRGMKAYLMMMGLRLLEIRRLLKPTGSLYLHCDPTASHYLKQLLDILFGRAALRNEIVWCYTGPGSPGMRQFNRKHDIIFWYVAGAAWTFNQSAARVPHKDGAPHRGGFKAGGVRIEDPKYARQGKILEDWWCDIAIAPRRRKEYLGYPTQKPLALLKRIIQAGSNEGDMVLDPFCGCATAPLAAEALGRQWVGIDISPKAAELVAMRLKKELGLFGEFTHRTDIPKRTDQGKVPSYRTQKHILFGKQEGICAGCRVSFPFGNFTLDHVIPQANSGTDHKDNLQLLCGACNSMKGKGSQEAFLAKLKEQGIR